MKLIELVVSMTLMSGTAGTLYTVLDVPALLVHATPVSERATCRMVDTGIAAYAVQHGRPPTHVADVLPYVHGDLAGYRIVDGAVVGPGCPTSGWPAGVPGPRPGSGATGG
ncbi:MAG: hypothetical protein HKP61_05580 [Dactylosporangium sp.]|nr:hypothetical protein [Dactylosporangium sp.]NNJ60418.1 hypothetical protein [Dactylosporangium sp.]